MDYHAIVALKHFRTERKWNKYDSSSIKIPREVFDGFKTEITDIIERLPRN